ncbi:hypothetical protein Nepgr_028395 [Nepenthes gracilis]|uniref:Choline transporter-like protein n=1 Tax=Nepenthes gracilis TaxID=150966 RepID=A0AAD3TDL5_NEPGR|nr:hypothetical protein Nepgr_028395 [Nepenthes gracilis]
MQMEGPGSLIESPSAAGVFSRKLLVIFFFLNFFLVAFLTVALVVRGILLSREGKDAHHFRPLDWYAPLFASVGCAGIVALAWQIGTRCNPSRVINAAFWFGPLLTIGIGVLLVSAGSAGGLAVGVSAIVSAVVLSLYGCWVHPRLNYAGRVLLVSTATLPAKTIPLTISAIITGVLYSCFLVSGIGGATAAGSSMDTLFIVVIVLSFAWTMQVIKNILQVTISRIKYLNFASGMDVDTSTAFSHAVKYSMGTICAGSIVVPVLGLIRGSSRFISLVAGDTEEFMFSCTSCCSSVASKLIYYGNRWGFVHVGVYDKGIVRASKDTWEMFGRAGMGQLIDTDLTSSFCFLCGLSGGAVSSLVGGSWALALREGYATQISFYAFFIGYFMTRVAMAWLQACVSAYYVAFAENPQSARSSLLSDSSEATSEYSTNSFVMGLCAGFSSSELATKATKVVSLSLINSCDFDGIVWCYKGTASCLDENQLAKSSAVSLRTFAALIQAPHLPLSLIKIDPNFVAEQAARESSHTKQDQYAEMRRRRDEKHEAKEWQLQLFLQFSRSREKDVSKKLEFKVLRISNCCNENLENLAVGMQVERS